MLWSSSDLENWQERGEIFAQPKDENAASWGDRAGFMEFPYLLSFGDKDVLMLGGHPVRYGWGDLTGGSSSSSLTSRTVCCSTTRTLFIAITRYVWIRRELAARHAAS